MNFEKIKEIQVAFLGACILVALVLSTVILSISLVNIKAAEDQQINVTGAASMPITSDFAAWQCAFSQRAGNMKQAYALLKEDRDRIIAYLKEKGVPDAQIAPQPIYSETLYERTSNGANTNTIEGYLLRQNIRVETKNVDLVDTLSRDASELINQGIGLESMPPEYYFTKLDDLKVKMLGEATKNAKLRAQSMAENTGNRIGLMRSSQMGVFQITPLNSTEVSDYGINDTTSKRKKVTAVVSVSFAVK